eukprot:GHVU01138037.1.p1 GENE.GHVU01138037.1~~GHVU01138037.1.p1  ORF type:complete len:634 (-),score=104.46 GHVU01138037.1:997-2898(-)
MMAAANTAAAAAVPVDCDRGNEEERRHNRDQNRSHGGDGTACDVSNEDDSKCCGAGLSAADAATPAAASDPDFSVSRRQLHRTQHQNQQQHQRPVRQLYTNGRLRPPRGLRIATTLKDFVRDCVAVHSTLSSAPLHLAIGVMDGVHLGHRALLGIASAAAAHSGGVSGVLTFDPHPAKALQRWLKYGNTPPQPPHLKKHQQAGTPSSSSSQASTQCGRNGGSSGGCGNDPGDPSAVNVVKGGKGDLIITLRERQSRLFNAGVDVVVTQPFDREFASKDPKDFCLELQRSLPGLAALYVGADFRFGKAGAGDVKVLQSTMQAVGVDVVCLGDVSWFGNRISSTLIRRLLSEDGDAATAERLLAADVAVEGVVEEEPRSHDATPSRLTAAEAAAAQVPVGTDDATATPAPPCHEDHHQSFAFRWTSEVPLRLGTYLVEMTKTRLGGNVCDNGDGAWTEGSCQPPSAVADEDEVGERTNGPPSQEVGGGGRAGPTELPRPTIEAEEGLSSLEAAAPAFAPPLLGVAVCGFQQDNQSSAVAAEWAKEGPILAPLLRVFIPRRPTSMRAGGSTEAAAEQGCREEPVVASPGDRVRVRLLRFLGPRADGAFVHAQLEEQRSEAVARVALSDGGGCRRTQ